MRERSSPWLVASTSALIAVAGAAVVVWPQGVGAERILPFVWTTALRGVLVVALPAVALTLVAAAVRWRASRAVAVPVAVALVLASVANALVLGQRAFAPEGAAADPGGSAADTVRVLSWNTEHAAPGADRISEVIESAAADIVVLPETDAAAATAIAAALQSSGHRVARDTVAQAGFPGSVPTSVVFLDEHADAGYLLDDRAGSTPGQPSGLWIPAAPTAPIVGAVHTVPPTPWGLPLWSAGLDWVAASCADPRAVVAGDLNATLDHFGGPDFGGSDSERAERGGADLGRCRDAASARGAAARGTWPADAPEWLASPIDHILVGSAWRVLSFDVLDAGDGPRSDHRAILAVIAPAD